MQQPARARLKAHTDPPVAVSMQHTLPCTPGISQPNKSQHARMQWGNSTQPGHTALHALVWCTHLQCLERDGAAVRLCGSQMGQHHQHSGATKVTPAAHDIHNDTCKGCQGCNIHRSAGVHQPAQTPGQHECKTRRRRSTTTHVSSADAWCLMLMLMPQGIQTDASTAAARAATHGFRSRHRHQHTHAHTHTMQTRLL